MKLSKNTFDVLKNYSQINQSIWVNEGDQKLQTISVDKSIVSYAAVEETFPTDFGIYNLNEFLASASLFEDPDFEFQDKQVVITDDTGSKLTFRYVAKEIVISPPAVVKYPETDVSFTLTDAVIQRIMKAAGVISAPSLVIETMDNKIVLRVTDDKVSSSHAFSMEICEYDGDADFSLILSIDNLRLMGYDYDVELSKKRISKWSNESAGIEYYVALGLDSTYTE